VKLWLFGAGLAALPWLNAVGQVPVTITAYDTPMACIEALHDGLISLSLEQSPGGLAQRFQRLEPLIVATHDLPFIAEFTVRRHWARFDDEEREAFLQSFQRLSVMSYASRFVALSEDTFRIQESRVLGSGRVQVIASITRAEPPDIPIEYILQQNDAGWRIINVVADGVSDLALKRAEYQRVLGEGSVADLLEVLEQQIAAL
jgi:phospholipid transport system substrate-binding protein